MGHRNNVLHAKQERMQLMQRSQTNSLTSLYMRNMYYRATRKYKMTYGKAKGSEFRRYVMQMSQVVLSQLVTKL